MGNSPIRLILNGKKAGDQSVRDAVVSSREQGSEIEVRVTWEAGDVPRLINEALADGVRRLMVGGGDGSVNEAVTGLLQLPFESRPELAILPLGTANDFATGAGIPKSPDAALELALTGKAVPVDAVRANDRAFINVATAGIGAQITAETPVTLKNLLGGGAYTLMGLVKAISFSPFSSGATTDALELAGKVIVGAVCNGRQAGGGQLLAPKALINDGMMDVVVLLEFPVKDVDIVIKELRDGQQDGQYVKRLSVERIEMWAEGAMPINLDGEPYQAERIDFEVLHEAVRLILPPDCPLI